MRTRPLALLLWPLAPLLLAAPLPALAETEPPACRVLLLGVADFGDAGFRRGGLGGVDAGDTTGVLDLLLCRARHAGEDGGRHARLEARDLGLGSRTIAMEAGDQGRWRVFFEQRHLPQARTAARTVFSNPGSADLRLPANWQPGATTAAMSQLLPSLGPVDLGVDRRHAGLGLSAWLGERWQVDSRYQEQRRQGLRSFAGLIGNGGGNARVVALPEPVDQRTRDVDFGLRYAGDALQLRLGLLVSRFENALDGIRWDNPYAGVAGWHPSASHPNGRGQAGLMPDNRFGQVSLNLGYRVAPTTRLNADIALGRMTQDQVFLPYTINPVLAAGITEPLPRARFDGRVDTTLLQLRLNARPNRHWHWQAAYRFDERDNRSPREGWYTVGGDSQLQVTGPTSNRLRFNLPVGHREQRVSAEGGWRSGRVFDARAGLERRATTRTWSARANSDEWRHHLTLRGRFGNGLTLGTRLLHSERDGGTYLGNRPFLDSYAPGYTDTVAGQFENLPGLRQYHLADRRRLQGAAFATWELGEAWHLGLTHARTRDDYHRSELGLQAAHLQDTLLDLAWRPGGDWSLSAFAGRERLGFDQAGRAFSGGAVRLPQANDPARNWFAHHRDRVDSAGLGLRRSFGEGRWELSADAARSHARGEVQVLTGPALASAPLPPTSARLRTLDARIGWRLDARQSLELRWRIEAFRGRDWASDGVGPNQLANVILLGEDSPDFTARALLLAWRLAL